MITIPKTLDIPIGGDVSLKVEYIENIERFPLRQEEMHGIHLFNDDEITYTISSITLCIGDYEVDALAQMDYPTIEKFKSILE